MLKSEDHRNLDYGGNGDSRQMLDWRLPPNAQRPGPLIIWFHGGGWYKGDKHAHNVPPHLTERYLTRGYAVASANYRLAQHSPFPAQIHDGKAAIRYLRSHAQQYNLDPERIGVWGQSAGAYLAVFLGVTNGNLKLEGRVGRHLDQSSAVQVVVNRCAPTDMTLPNQPKDLWDPFEKMLGTSVAQKPALAAQASPITYVTSRAVPMLILHGDIDPIVPLAHAQLLETALQQAGVEVTFITLKNTGHGGGGFLLPATDTQTAGFFDKHLCP